MFYNGMTKPEKDPYFFYNKLTQDLNTEVSGLIDNEKQEIDMYFNKKVEEFEYRINEIINNIEPVINKAEIERKINEAIKKLFK